MRRRHKFSAVDQTVATILGAIWLIGGFAGIVAGILQSHWQPIVLGSGALWYASLWLRVAARRRLLTWSELAIPWRTRKRAE